MLSFLCSLITGTEKIDLNDQFNRHSERVEELEARLKEDPGLAYSIRRENMLVNAISRKLDRGETTMTLNRGESLYDKLMAG